MATSKKTTTKNGIIAQRVPVSTERQLTKLANNATLPRSVLLQLLIEKEYKRVYKTK